MKYLNIALPKGRLADLSIRLFDAVGIDCTNSGRDSRKLIIADEILKVRFFMVKPADVPTYVEYGAADMGIAGKDTLMEEARDLYEVLDLGFSKCRMVLAAPYNASMPASFKPFPAASATVPVPYLKEYLDRMGRKRIATKYPRIAREYFEHKWSETVEVIQLNGSVELAPLVGLSEMIVDLVETGRTLRDNGLVLLDNVADVSARLVVNRVSMKMESARIGQIIDGLRSQLVKAGDNGDKDISQP